MNRRLFAFFGLGLLLSWLCWVPLALTGTTIATGAGRWLAHAGGLGPLLATLLMLAPRGQQATRQRWWRRLTGFGGLASPAGAFCVLLPLLLLQLTQDSYTLTGGLLLPALPAREVLLLAVPTLLLVALPQELAWRGYALPAMVHGRDPVAPTLLLGALWGLWHLPLFFMTGSYQAGISLASAAGALFFINLVAQSLMMTALYLATRCTWAAVAFHGLTILCGEIWQLPVAAEIHRTLWTVVAAGVLLLLKTPLGLQMPETPPAEPAGRHRE